MTAERIERQLSLARRGLTPSSQLSLRVRARFGAAEQPSSPAATRVGDSALRARWRALRASGNLGLAVGGGLFGLGCVVGLLGSGLVVQGRDEAVSRALRHPAELAAPSFPPAPAAPSQDQTPAPLAAAEPTAPLTPAAPAPPASPRQPARADSAPRGRSEARSQPRAVTSRDWRGELELLERAERAVRADNAALALALLGDFDVRYPESRLVEERAAVETMAHCQATAPDGGARAARFLNQHPRSLYRTRVEAVCPPAAPAADRSDKKIGAGH